MENYVGIDVSLELSSICVVNASGVVLRETKVASEPEAIVALIKNLQLPISRVGLEAGPLSQWLHDGISQGGYDTVLLETRRVARFAQPLCDVRSCSQDSKNDFILARSFTNVCRAFRASSRSRILSKYDGWTVTSNGMPVTVCRT